MLSVFYFGKLTIVKCFLSQEFAVFALVGLLTDFFLQMVFFVTVLSLDIRRMEVSTIIASVKFKEIYHFSSN